MNPKQEKHEREFKEEPEEQQNISHELESDEDEYFVSDEINFQINGCEKTND